MNTKQALIIVGLLIVAGLLAHYFTNQARTGNDIATPTATAPSIKQDMCVKNGRIWDSETEKCIAGPDSE